MRKQSACHLLLLRELRLTLLLRGFFFLLSHWSFLLILGFLSLLVNKSLKLLTILLWDIDIFENYLVDDVLQELGANTLVFKSYLNSLFTSSYDFHLHILDVSTIFPVGFTRINAYIRFLHLYQRFNCRYFYLNLQSRINRNLLRIADQLLLVVANYLVKEHRKYSKLL